MTVAEGKGCVVVLSRKISLDRKLFDTDLLYYSFLALAALGERCIHLTGLEMTVAEGVRC